MNRIRSLVSIGLMACLLGLTNNANAQWGGGGMGGGRRGGMGQGRSGNDSKTEQDKSMSASNSSDQILMRLDSLHSELQLDPVKEALWAQFADRFNRYIDFLVKEKITQVPFDSTLSATTHVSRVVDSARNRYTLLEDLEEKTRLLYSSLSQSQKLQFDAKIQSVVIKDIGR
jgi:hypothetical protein